jgi:hypothetical protein
MAKIELEALGKRRNEFLTNLISSKNQICSRPKIKVEQGFNCVGPSF